MAIDKKYLEDVGVKVTGRQNEFVQRFVMPGWKKSEAIAPESVEYIIGTALENIDTENLNKKTISKYTHISTPSSFGDYSHKALGQMEFLKNLKVGESVVHTFFDIETLGERKINLAPGEVDYFAISEIGFADSKTTKKEIINKNKKTTGKKSKNIKYVTEEFGNREGKGIVGWLDDNKLMQYREFVQKLEAQKRAGASVVHLTKNERLLAQNLLKYADEKSFTSGAINIHNRMTGENHITGANILTKINQLDKAINNLTEYRNKPEAIVEELRNNFDKLFTMGTKYDKKIKAQGIAGTNLFGFDLPIVFDFLNEHKNVAGAKELKSTLESFIKNDQVLDFLVTHRTVYGEGSSGAANIARIARTRADAKNKEINISRYLKLKNGHLKQENVSIAYGFKTYMHSAAADAKVSRDIFAYGINDYMQTFIRGFEAEGFYARRREFAYTKENGGIKGGSRFIASGGTVKDPLFKVFHEVDGKLSPADSSRYAQSGFLKNMTYEYLGFKHITPDDLKTAGVSGNMAKYEHGLVAAVFKNVTEGTVSIMAVPETSTQTGIDKLLGYMHTKLVPETYDLNLEKGQLAISGFKDRAMRVYDKMYDIGGSEKVDKWLNVTKLLNANYYSLMDDIADGTVQPQFLDAELKKIYNSLSKENQEAFKNYTEFRNVFFASPRIETEREMFETLTQRLSGKIGTIEADYSFAALQDILEGKLTVPGLEGTSFGGRGYPTQTAFSDIIDIGGKSVNVKTFKDLMNSLKADESQIKQMLNSLVDANILEMDDVYNVLKSAGKADFRHKVANLISNNIYKIPEDELMAKIRNVSASSAYQTHNKGILDQILDTAMDEGYRRTPKSYKTKPIADRIQASQKVIDEQFMNAKRNRIEGAPKVRGPEKTEKLINNFISAFTERNQLMFDVIPDINTSTLTAVLYDRRQSLPGSANELRASQKTAKIAMPFLRDDFTFRIGKEAAINVPFLTIENGEFKLTSGIQMYYEEMTKEAGNIRGLLMSEDPEGVTQAQKVINRIRQRVMEQMSSADKFDTETALNSYTVKTSPRIVNQMRGGFIDIEGAIPGILERIESNPDSIFAKNLSTEKREGLINAYNYYTKHGRFTTRGKIAAEEAFILGGWGEILGIVGDVGSAKESTTASRLGVSMTNIREYIPFGFMSSTSNPRHTLGLGVHSLDFEWLQKHPEKSLVQDLLDPLVLTKGQAANMKKNEAFYLNLKVAQLDDKQLAQLFMDEGISGKVKMPVLPSTTEGLAIIRDDIAELFHIKDVTEYIVNEVDKDLAPGTVIGGDRKQVTIGKEYTKALQEGEAMESAIVKRTSYWDKLEKGTVKDIEDIGNGKHRVLIERTLKAGEGTKFKDESGGRYTVRLMSKEVFEALGLEDYHMISNARAPVLKHRAFGSEIASALRIVTDQIHSLNADYTVGKDIKEKATQDVIDTVKQHFKLDIQWKDGGLYSSKGMFEIGSRPFLDELNRLYDFTKVDIGAFYNDLGKIAEGKLWNENVNQITLAGGIKARTGFERVGVQFDENWYRSAGILNKEGRVKMSSRHLEILEEQKLYAAKDYFTKMIDEQVYLHDPSVGIKKPGEVATRTVKLGKNKEVQALGKVGQYVKAISKVYESPVDIAGDVFLRVNDIISDANQIELNKFAPVQQYMPGKAITETEFANTFFDLKGFSKLGEKEAHIAEEILKQGGAWVELPSEMRIDEKVIDKIWLMHSNVAHVQGTSEVYPDAIGSKTSRILRIIQEMQDFNEEKISITLGQEIKKQKTEDVSLVASRYFERKMTAAYKEYETELGKAFGKNGAVSDVLKTRLAGSGHFKLQTFNLMQTGVEEGAVYMTEERFTGMIKDWFGDENPELKRILSENKSEIKKLRKSGAAEDVIKQRIETLDSQYNTTRNSLKAAFEEQLAKAKDPTKGTFLYVGREPVFHHEAFGPMKVFVRDEFFASNKDNRALMTLGTALRLKGDSDGDNIFAHGSFFRDLYSYNPKTHKFELGGPGKTVYDEAERHWNSLASAREAFAKEAMADFEKSWDLRNNATYENLNEFAKRRSVEIIVRGQSPQTELESLYARYGRRLIGTSSDLHTGMRRMAISAMGIDDTVFTTKDFENVTKFMGELEQKGIQSKTTAIDTWIAKRYGDVGTLGHEQIDNIVTDIINMGNKTTDLIDAIKSTNINQIKDISVTLGLYESASDPVLIEELNSIRKLNHAMSGYLNAQEFKIGSGAPALEVAYDMLFSNDTVLSSDLQRIEEYTGTLTDRQRGQVARNFISSRLQEIDSYSVDGRLALDGTAEYGHSVGKATLAGMQDSINPQKLVKYTATAGAIFAGINIAGGLFTKPKGVDIPSEEPMGYDTGYITTPAPQVGSPSAYVTQDGYANRNISVSVRNKSGLVTFDIANMVSNSIGGGINNMSVNISDNSNRLDWLWTQDVIKNSMSKGYAY